MSLAGKRFTQRACPAIITNCNTRCPEHQAERDRARGTTTQRGYGSAHRAERERWAAILARQAVPCARCGAMIAKGEPFDLGHTEDRTAWSGPEHVTCNRSDGGRRGVQTQIERPFLGES